MSMQSLPVCRAPSVPKLEHQTSPHYPEDCTENTFLKLQPFILSDTTGRGDTKACAGEHGPDATILPLSKLKMLTSEACLKNYAVFDRCEGKDTVIVHPFWSNSPRLYSLPGSYFGHDTINSGGGMQLLQAKSAFHCSAFQSTVGFEAAFHNSAIAVDVQRKVASKNVNLMQENMYGATPLSGIKEEESFHENTEDIDALMSSDEELISTGHSPSDASLNCFSDAIAVHSKETAQKKRKFGYSAKDEADDADSGPCKLLPDQTILSGKRSGGSVSLHWTGGSDLEDALSGIGVSSRGKQGSAVNDVVCAKGCDYELIRSSGIFGGEPGGGSKRMKLKNNVQQLRNVVPGGDGLDTAGVLGQTIEYVKCLQRNLRDLKTARGFCAQASGQTGPW